MAWTVFCAHDMLLYNQKDIRVCDMDFLIENGVLIKVIDPEPSVIIPDLVRIIGSEAFLGCENITDVVIPNSVISIEQSAFACCNKIEKITIPDGVKNIDFYAFALCKIY